MTSLEVQLVYPDAKIPTRTHTNDAGYDLYAYNGIVISPHETVLIETGICIAVPNGTYGRIAPRSGLSTKGILVNAGVVDEGFRGMVKVVLHNMRQEAYEVKKDDRIAQLVIEVIMTPPVSIVDKLRDTKNFQKIDDVSKTFTTRGDSGFGSSGR